MPRDRAARAVASRGDGFAFRGARGGAILRVIHPTPQERAMYLAMNRFTVRTENAAAFEALWLGRESHLHKLDGFVEFHMLKGAEQPDGTILYASHTIWESEAHFLAWTRSEAFRASHSGARETRPLYEGAPVFEGFSTIQHITAPEKVADSAAG
jgi:heme-degrading monooxygenase HmoA